MLRKIWSFSLVLLVAACMPLANQKPQVEKPLPARLELSFQSNLPDLYYVMSGPAFTYNRYPVNKDFSHYLRGRLQAAAGPPSAPTGRLEVKVLTLTTDFDEIGSALPSSPARQLAMLNSDSPAARLLLAEDVDRDGDFNLPESTTKKAVMTYRVTLTLGGKVVAKDDLQASFSKRYDWYMDPPIMSQDTARYDYGEVFDGLYRQAWQQLRGFLDRNLS